MTSSIRRRRELIGQSLSAGFAGASFPTIAQTPEQGYGMRSVREFGAVGNGLADDTTALVKATRSGMSLYFPAGTYLTTEPLELLDATGKRYLGDGMGATRVVQLSTGVPVVRIHGSRLAFSSMSLAFAKPEARLIEKSTGLEFLAGGNVSKSIFENVELRGCNVGLYVGADNGFYSIAFRNIDIVDFGSSGIAIDPKASGTGCSFDCIYIQNSRMPCGDAPIVLRNLTDSFVGVIAVEHIGVRGPCYHFENCETIVLNSARCEGISFRGPQAAFVQVSGRTNAILGAFQANFCQFGEQAHPTDLHVFQSYQHGWLRVTVSFLRDFIGENYGTCRWYRTIHPEVYANTLEPGVELTRKYADSTLQMSAVP